MTLLEMMENGVDVVGLTVSLDLEDSEPLVGKVCATEKHEFGYEGYEVVTYYGISFNGWSYYTIDKSAKVLDIA